MHPLDSVRLKIRRAEGEIEELARLEEVFRQNADYSIVSEFNPKSRKYINYIQKGVTAPDPICGVYIGEIAYNLRSALDGLVWQLFLMAKSRGKAWTPSAVKRTQFPIFLVGRTKKFQPHKRTLIHHFWGKRFGDGQIMIKNLLSKHKALIEGLQPYKRGRRGKQCPLYWLKEINNTDKHRLAQVVSDRWSIETSSSTMYIPEEWEILESHYYAERVVPSTVHYLLPFALEDGTSLNILAEEVNMQTKLTPHIAFGDSCEAVMGKLAIHCLTQIADDVSGIIELFDSEF